jgi:hypothetical protein
MGRASLRGPERRRQYLGDGPLVTLPGMKRVLLALTMLTLVAATPDEALPGLDSNGYFIEAGSDATEQVVSDAVFAGRADGGRLYIVVLAEEPPGGAPTFADSMLALLDGDGYVLAVSPETVGWAGDGSFWTADDMNEAVEASRQGGTDDQVVEQFVDTLTGEAPVADGDGFSIVWILVAGVVGVGIWMFFSSRGRARRNARRLEEIREVAKEKLDEVANDILEMETEVTVSEDSEVKDHYQRASAMYTKATEDNQRATTVAQMLDVSQGLDLAIWELDCAEAILDGKPIPPKPEPPAAQAPPPPPVPIPEGHGELPNVPGTVDQYDRRPQRHSSGSSDLMTMLMTMMAMGSMRGGGGFGGWGGGGGGSRMGGGGFRMGGGGGRMRGGGRRG